MKQDARLITAIDVGTTKVCTIIGRKIGPRDLEVLAYSVAPCEGLSKGNVADIAATGKAIRASVKEVEQNTGITIESAYVGVTGAHVSYENRWDTMGWAGKQGVVTAEELAQVPEVVFSSSTPTSGRQVIHAMPVTYSLDGMKGIRNPLGMHTRDLEVETHVVTGASSFIDKLVVAVQKAGIRLDALVLEPLASGEAVLTPQERHRGVVLVDIGGGTTDLVVFRKGRIFHTAVIPVGGFQFTNDISQTYNTPYQAAEEIKLKYAHTEPSTVRQTEQVSFPVHASKTERRVPLHDICQLTRERAQELAGMIKLKLEEAQLGDNPNVNLVLTGGTSNLRGLRRLVEQSLKIQVRIGVPDGQKSIPDELKAPAFATGVGILLWVAMNQPKLAATHASNGSRASVTSGRDGLIFRLLNLARSLLSKGLFSASQGRF